MSSILSSSSSTYYPNSSTSSDSPLTPLRVPSIPSLSSLEYPLNSSDSSPASLSVSSSSILALGSSSPSYSPFSDPKSLTYSVLQFKRRNEIEGRNKVATQLISEMNQKGNITGFEFHNKHENRILKLVAKRIDEIEFWPDNGRSNLVCDKILMALMESNPEKAREKILSYIKARDFPGFFFDPKYNDFLMQIAPHITNLILHLPSIEEEYGTSLDISYHSISAFIEKFPNVESIRICAIDNEDGHLSIRSPKLKTLVLDVENLLESFSVDSPVLQRVVCYESHSLEKFSINSVVFERSNSHPSLKDELTSYEQLITLPGIEVTMSSYQKFCRYISSSSSSSSSSYSSSSIGSPSTSLSSGGPSTASPV